MSERPAYTTRILRDPEGRFAFKNTQDVTGILRAAHDARDTLRKDTGPIGGRYLGTIPVLVAQLWAKECGAAIGTKEWAEYAKKKLKDPEWAGFRIHR
jgi:hypothetical protein